MLDLLIEGFESAWLPCSLIVLVPGAAAVLAADDDRVPTLAGFATSVLLLSWLRFGARGGDWPLAVSAVALASAVVLFVVPLFEPDQRRATVAGLLAGGAAAELWEPCVGSAFGQLLNELPARSGSGIGLLAFYVAGVLSPLIVLVAALRLVPADLGRRLRVPLIGLGAAVLIVSAVATAVGLHDEIAGRLIRWSL